MKNSQNGDLKALARKLRNLILRQQKLGREIQALREEVEDTIDGQSLAKAIEQSKGSAAIPWAAAKKRLGLD